MSQNASPTSTVSALEAVAQRLAQQDATLAQQEATLQAEHATVAILQAELETLKIKTRYTTQSEADIGTLILKDLEQKRLTLFEPVAPQLGTLTIDAQMLAEDLRPTLDKKEDREVNAPMSKVAQALLPVGFRAVLTVNRSKLIDHRGREQRADIVLLDGGREQWPSVVSMVVGKVDLATSNHKSALGQAMRRGRAILDSQPWRDFVVIPITCLSRIGFIRLDRSFKPSPSNLMACLSLDASLSDVVVGRGARCLSAFLARPELMGYTPCPTSIKLAELALHTRGQAFIRVFPICARTPGKAVFGLVTAEGEVIVLKTYASQALAQREHEALTKLSGVPGVIGLFHRNVVQVTVTEDNDQVQRFAVLLAPFGDQVLTPSVATPAIFSQYAHALAAAAKKNVFHNDVSPDNLLCVSDAKGQNGIVADWEISSGGEYVFDAFAGKPLFAPEIAFEPPRQPSLNGDLESLYYVAVACATGEASWAREQVPGELGDVSMRRARKRVCLGRDPFPEGWHSYLAPIRDALCTLPAVSEGRSGGRPRTLLELFTAEESLEEHSSEGDGGGV
jgi:hypothetical protein